MIFSLNDEIKILKRYELTKMYFCKVLHRNILSKKNKAKNNFLVLTSFDSDLVKNQKEKFQSYN